MHSQRGGVTLAVFCDNSVLNMVTLDIMMQPKV